MSDKNLALLIDTTSIRSGMRILISARFFGICGKKWSTKTWYKNGPQKRDDIKASLDKVIVLKIFSYVVTMARMYVQI